MATVVLPGDSIPVPSSSSLRLGPGLLQLPPPPSASTNDKGKAKADGVPKVVATRVGLLGSQSLEGGKVERRWVEGESRRYVPALGEPVLGIITARHAEGYRVDIGSAHPAALDALAFEGATKRSKPSLKIGAVVYGRVSLAHSFTDPEIECVDPTTQRAEGYGEMTGGMLIRDIELSRCRALITPPQQILHDLGKKRKFEVSIGMNGRVWVKSEEVRTTLELVREIKGRPL